MFLEKNEETEAEKGNNNTGPHHHSSFGQERTSQSWLGKVSVKFAADRVPGGVDFLLNFRIEDSQPFDLSALFFSSQAQ